MAILKSAKARAASITSAIGSGLKSAASKVVSAVKSIGQAGSKGSSYANVSSALGSNASSTPSGAPSAPSASYPSNLNNSSVQVVGSSGGSSGALPQVYGSSTPLGTYAPSPIYSAPVRLAGGSSPVTSTASFAPTGDDSVISSASMGGGSEGGSMASSPSFSLPSAPIYANPGQINNGGLVSSLSGDYTYDPNTNSFVPATSDNSNSATAPAEVQKRNKLQEWIQKMIPKKDSVQDDPLIRAQNEEIQRRKQEVATYTSQLNNVVAQQNADLLRLRGIGSQEGVTETVYGGQAATINREAAIKALPIQAQVAAAQGNLDLAQDYLTQLTTWKTEQITNDYNYKTALYSSIKDFVKGEEKIRLDELTKNNDRAYDMAQKNIQIQADLMGKAITAGNAALISRINGINPSSPNFMAEIGRAAGSLATSNAKTSGGVLANLPTSIQGKLITQADKFGSDPIVKKYVSTVDSIGIVNGIDPKTKNPADHQTIVYAFAKALDPDSAVKEGEYETIKKYAQSTASRYGKEISNAIKGTGFLSEGAIKNIQTTMNNLEKARKPQYDKLYSEKTRVINNIAGSDVAKDVLIDYTVDSPTTNSIKSPYVITTPAGKPLDMSLFEK